MALNDPVIVAARRTAIRSVRASGAAAAGQRVLDPVPLAAAVLRAVRDDSGAAPEDVVLGSARGPGGNLARVASLAAGLGVAVPGVSVDRQCGSGLEAIRLAAALVGSGAVEVVLAGGVESASAAGPGRAAFAPEGFADPEMGCAAEDLAREQGVDRVRQDAYAARSHRLSLAARDQGCFADELVAVAGIERDDRPRPLTAAALARFPAAFVPGGSVTAGNSCGVSDGAAAVAVVSERVRAEARLPGLRILGSAVSGVDPALPGLGPVPAIRRVLEATGVALDQVSMIEITEAFAAQLLACTDALGLDPFEKDAHRVCPQGGAIGLGHPWAASGALLVVRLFAELVRADRSGLGLAACAVGGGQGVALLVERVG